MKIILIVLISIPLFFTSCSCERTEGGEQFDDPAWVADKFYEAYARKDFEEASFFCDKHSKNSLEAISYRSDYMADVSYIKVDSCDLFEEHAYCYCRYKDEDSIEQVDKLLLRNYNDYWKVHFSKGGVSQYSEESILYTKKAEKNEDAPESLQGLTNEELETLDSVFVAVVQFINDVDVVVGFFEEDQLMNKESLAYKENTYDDYYIRKNFLKGVSLEHRYYFVESRLTKYEAILFDFDANNGYGAYDYLIRFMQKEYGDPYNMQKISSENWYKYKEVKWFLKGYNEELILSANNYDVSIVLREAY